MLSIAMRRRMFYEPCFVHFRREQPHADAVDDSAARCAVCLEVIPGDADLCPECGECTSAPPASAGPDSFEEEGNWLKDHWRPTATMTHIAGLIALADALPHPRAQPE